MGDELNKLFDVLGIVIDVEVIEVGFDVACECFMAGCVFGLSLLKLIKLF